MNNYKLIVRVRILLQSVTAAAAKVVIPGVSSLRFLSSVCGGRGKHFGSALRRDRLSAERLTDCVIVDPSSSSSSGLTCQKDDDDERLLTPSQGRILRASKRTIRSRAEASEVHSTFCSFAKQSGFPSPF